MSKSTKGTKAVALLAEQSVGCKIGPVIDVEATVVSEDTPLNAAEQMKFEQCEEALKNNLGSFRLIGRALKAIKDDRLYREKFKRFEDYCAQQWGLSDKYAYRLIQAYEVYVGLRKDSTIGEQNLPANESQIRPLLRLETDKQAAAWNQVVKSANGKRVTAEMVEDVVNAKLGNGDAKPKLSPTKQKLDKIAKLVKKALKDTSEPTVDQLKKVLEEIQGLIGGKKKSD